MSGSKVIIVKKKSGHGGHHGGAWKVAYADFVTAMMSLFIVLWLMNANVKIRQAVAGYFNDPRGKSTMTGTDQSGTSDNLALTENNIPDLKRKIEEAIRKMNDLKALQNQIQITITPEGLRIELLETKDGTFFDSGSAKLNKNGQELLEMLSQQLGGLPNRISIEGHTDAQPFASKDGYGNWDLSTDRANAARRVMENSGLRENQVSQVRGYADQKLRVPSDPLDPSNRRISMIVQYLTADAPPVLGNKGAGRQSANAGTPAAKPGTGPTVDTPASKSGTGTSAAENPGGAATAAKGSTSQQSETRNAAPTGAQNGAQNGAGNGAGKATQNGAQAGSSQSGGKAVPAQKPAAGKPMAQSAVSRLWQKIHPK